MNRLLRILAAAIALATVFTWAALGASRGWTKTSVPVKTVDEVTGIEGISYRKQFVPGVDFLGAGLFALAFWLALHFSFVPKPIQPTTKTTETKMKIKLIATLALAAFAGFASAAPQSFDFKDPKGVNNAVFKLDAPLEAISGSASGISGTVEFDAENPGATKGKIVVAAESLTVPNPMQKEHLHSVAWMDVAKFKEITFEAKELKDCTVSFEVDDKKKLTGKTEIAGKISGTFTCKGVSKEITVPVKLTYLKDKLGSRVPKMEGDLLVIRASFIIKRSDYGINPGAPADKVSDEIELTLSIAGASPKK